MRKKAKKTQHKHHAQKKKKTPLSEPIKRSEGFSLKKTAFLMVIIALITIGAVSIFYAFYVIDLVRIIPMDLEVTDYIGVTGDTDALHFGATRPGGGATRFIILSNPKDCHVSVHLEFSGELGKRAKTLDYDFILAPNESRKIAVQVSATSAEVGSKYYGELKIVYKKIWWFNKLLGV
ncbi:hypothetical protein ACFL0W_06370 [Nanoarchaeota archaeon]